MRIAILGGSGNFGARIVRALHHEPGVELLVIGRRPRSVEGADGVASIALDLAAPDFGPHVALLAPGLVINCTGPFQGQDYRAARAALAAGAHYIDLADGRTFVEGFADELHKEAIQAGRAAITAASTLPALSCAVAEELGRDLRQLRSIQSVIAPGQLAARGRATLEGVFSYLGQAFPVWQEGAWRPMYGWMNLRRVTLDVGERLAAACDVPDLALFPRHFAGVETVTFHAALELAVQHRALWCLAGLRRLGLPFTDGPVGRWAVALNRVAPLFDGLAGSQGGMAVEVTGTRNDGTGVSRSWQLVAPAMDGPEIPCMPAILLARRLAEGVQLQPGAYPCIGLLHLSDFEPEFRKWGIVTRTVDRAL